MPTPGYNPSARTELARLRRSLNAVFERAADVDPSTELAGDMSRYVCLRVSGFLEQSLLALGRSACERMSGGTAKTFGLSWLERAPSPSSGEIVRFIRRFSNKWAAELKALLDDDQRGGRLNALVGIRNDVAHGKNQGVSVHQAQGYYDLAVEIIDWIADRLEPKPGMQPASAP